MEGNVSSNFGMNHLELNIVGIFKFLPHRKLSVSLLQKQLVDSGWENAELFNVRQVKYLIINNFLSNTVEGSIKQKRPVEDVGMYQC